VSTTKLKVNCTVIGWWVEVCILSRTFASPESGQNNTTYLLSVSRQTTGFRSRSATPSIDLRPTRLFQYVSVTLSGAHLSTFVLTMAVRKVHINVARCMWNDYIVSQRQYISQRIRFNTNTLICKINKYAFVRHASCVNQEQIKTSRKHRSRIMYSFKGCSFVVHAFIRSTIKNHMLFQYCQNCSGNSRHMVVYLLPA